MFPELESISRVMRRAVVDFPDPDSPTRPSVSPGRMSKETSSTAWTRAISFWNRIPRVIGKYFVRWRTLTSAPSCGSSVISGWVSATTLIRPP